MTDNTQPEALRLANVCSNLTRYSMDAHLIAAELRRLHAYCQELESQVILDCMTHVQNPAAVYAELPPRYYLAGGVEKTWDHQQMHAFADATHALRTQQPAPATQQAGEAPLPLLVRDIAADLGTTPIQVCTALAALGFGGHSVNMAVTPRTAQSLRAHFASPTAQADSQPAPVEVADAMADSQYLAGVSAGWNAANADDPNAALQKLHESRAGYLKPLSAARAPADSVLEDAARWHWIAEYLVGPRTDLDDEIVASETVNELSKLVDAARATADSVLEDVALSGEQQRAIFEAYESAASESYFEARPQIDCNDRRRVFKAGYERGWDAARKQGGA